MQARKLAYYLNWMEIKTAIFNHGDYRRKRLGGRQPAEFFRPDNEEGMKLRYDMAKEALVRRVDSHTESHVEETCSTYLLLCAHNVLLLSLSLTPAVVTRALLGCGIPVSTPTDGPARISGG
jgi:hypothetical protein